MSQNFSHVIGFDDAPFGREHRGDVTVVGVVFADQRLDGVLCDRVRRDGVNATRVLARMVTDSKFGAQVQLVMVQGIALAGFNVVDLHRLHAMVGVPVVAVARRPPDLERIRRTLLRRVPGGRRKWNIIAGLQPMEPMADIYVQRIGIPFAPCRRVIERLAIHGNIPEPLRAAHLIAGAFGRGESRGRV